MSWLYFQPVRELASLTAVCEIVKVRSTIVSRRASGEEMQIVFVLKRVLEECHCIIPNKLKNGFRLPIISRLFSGGSSCFDKVNYASAWTHAIYYFMRGHTRGASAKFCLTRDGINYIACDIQQSANPLSILDGKAEAQMNTIGCC